MSESLNNNPSEQNTDIELSPKKLYIELSLYTSLLAKENPFRRLYSTEYNARPQYWQPTYSAGTISVTYGTLPSAPETSVTGANTIGSLAAALGIGRTNEDR